MSTAKGQKLKEQGQAKAEITQAHVLCLARELAIQAAMQRPTRLATIDDVIYLLRKQYNIWPDKLGAAAGSVFKGPYWEFVRWAPSRRTSNHARSVRIWKLKE